MRLTPLLEFEAVLETSYAGPGGRFRVTDLWGSLFLDVGISNMTMNGERVFIDDGGVRPLGIPLEVSMLFVDVAAGWRHAWPPLAVCRRWILTTEVSRDIRVRPARRRVHGKRTGPLFLLG